MGLNHYTSGDLEIEKKKPKGVTYVKKTGKSTFKCVKRNFFICKNHLKTICDNSYEE